MKRSNNPIPFSGTGIWSLFAVVAGAIYLYKKRGAIGDALNPSSTSNVAYRGANAILQSITGNTVDSIGTAMANNIPSAMEKQVNELYGPDQLWKMASVYNTPGKPGYNPNLPASYPPSVHRAAIGSTTLPYFSLNPFESPSRNDSPQDAIAVEPTLLGRWI